MSCCSFYSRLDRAQRKVSTHYVLDDILAMYTIAIIIVFNAKTCVCSVSVAAIVTMGIGVQLVNEDPGRLFTFVNEDVNSVSFQISAFEDVSVRLYSQDSTSSATRKLMQILQLE